jgi:hypothetical protein
MRHALISRTGGTIGGKAGLSLAVGMASFSQDIGYVRCSLGGRRASSTAEFNTKKMFLTMVPSCCKKKKLSR